MLKFFAIVAISVLFAAAITRVAEQHYERRG